MSRSRRLGALPMSPRALLEDSAVRVAVEHSAESDDPDVIAHAVLSVVAADVSQAEGLWWLSDLVLRDADGELVPANALVIPGSDAAAVLDEEEVAPVDQAIVDRYGREAVEAVGVLSSLGTLSAADVPLDELPEALADLDGIEDWADDVAPDGSRFGAVVGELRGDPRPRLDRGRRLAAGAGALRDLAGAAPGAGGAGSCCRAG